MAQILLGTLGIVAFSALSWVILLSAVASMHSLLADALDTTFSNLSSSTEDNGVIADALGLAWWMVWYQFLLLIAVSTSAVMGMIQQHSQLFGNLFAALFALQMYNAHEAAIWNRAAEGSVNKYESRAGAYLAGAIMCGMSSAIMIIWLGLLSSVDNSPGSDGGKRRKGAHGTPLPSTMPSGQYVATATGGSAVTPPAPVGGYAPHQSPHMPALPPAPPAYNGYGPQPPAAPPMVADNRYGSQPSF